MLRWVLEKNIGNYPIWDWNDHKGCLKLLISKGPCPRCFYKNSLLSQKSPIAITISSESVRLLPTNNLMPKAHFSVKKTSESQISVGNILRLRFFITAIH